MRLKLTKSSEIIWKKYTENQHIKQMQKYRQHGHISTYDHCLNVAILSCKIGQFLRFKADAINNIIIGSMLHDFYLYNYHKTGRKLPDGIHCWIHPEKALKNAEKLFCLNTKQRNIIRSHMFPLHPFSSAKMQRSVDSRNSR